MANKKKKKRKGGKRIDWKYLTMFVIVQILILSALPLAIYVTWPSNERNTQTVTGEIEQIEWKRRYGHNSSYVQITVGGEDYRLYGRSGRKEMHSKDIAQALEPGDVVEIAYKTGFHNLKPHNFVIGLKDQTQVYRSIEVFNANAPWLVAVLIALFVIAEVVFCAPFYLAELLILVINVGGKNSKKKKQKVREESK